MDDVRKKIFVIDTSVLIEDPDVFYKLGGNEIVVPTAVIKELDGLKRHPDQGKTDVIDADISKYFDTISHDKLCNW